MTFAVVIEGMTIVAFAILIGGGKQMREQGWGVMAILAGLAALIQVAAMTLVVGSSNSISHEDSLIRLLHRPTSSRMTIVSSRAGFLIRAGSCALYRGVSKLFAHWLLWWRRWSYRLRVAMS